MTDGVQLRIIRALPFTGDAAWNYQNISDSYHTVYYILAGDGHIRSKQGVMDLAPGYAYLIPRGLAHDLWCDSHICKAYIDLHVELLPGYDALAGGDGVRQLPVGMDVCRKMFQAVQQQDLRARTYLQGQLMTALAAFLPESVPDLSPMMASFLPVIEDVQKNLHASIRREDYARRYGWNPSSFSRAFHKAFGCGFKEYVERLLTDRLVEALLVTDKTLQLLADEYGFCDAYYLSAFFKRRTGVAPAVYRKRRM